MLVNNRLSNDNLDGDTDFAAAEDSQTTCILIAAGLPFPGPALPPITGTVIRNNHFPDVAIGIWTLNVPAASNAFDHNKFGPGVTNLRDGFTGGVRLDRWGDPVTAPVTDFRLGDQASNATRLPFLQGGAVAATITSPLRAVPPG